MGLIFLVSKKCTPEGYLSNFAYGAQIALMGSIFWRVEFWPQSDPGIHLLGACVTRVREEPGETPRPPPAWVFSVESEGCLERHFGKILAKSLPRHWWAGARTYCTSSCEEHENSTTDRECEGPHQS